MRDFFALRLSLSFSEICSGNRMSILASVNTASLKTLIALVPASMLFCGSLVLFFRRKAVCSSVQLLGAACLVVVVLTHVFETFHMFPWMNWGRGKNRPLSRLLERGSWPLAVSSRIFVAFADKAPLLKILCTFSACSPPVAMK
jgi:hypothetical protein